MMTPDNVGMYDSVESIYRCQHTSQVLGQHASNYRYIYFTYECMHAWVCHHSIIIVLAYLLYTARTHNLLLYYIILAAYDYNLF